MSMRTRWRNWKLRRERRKLRKELKRVSAEAREKKDEQIREEWMGLNGSRFGVIEWSIKENDCRDLLDQAERMYLPTPTPNDKDKWVYADAETSFDLPTSVNFFVLTPEAMTELNAAIRQEKKARREVWESWAKIIGTIVTGLTGIIGTIIGLVAVLKK